METACYPSEALVASIGVELMGSSLCESYRVEEKMPLQMNEHM
jgi:hypothetical protein